MHIGCIGLGKMGCTVFGRFRKHIFEVVDCDKNLADTGDVVHSEVVADTAVGHTMMQTFAAGVPVPAMYGQFGGHEVMKAI